MKYKLYSAFLLSYYVKICEICYLRFSLIVEDSLWFSLLTAKTVGVVMLIAQIEESLQMSLLGNNLVEEVLSDNQLKESEQLLNIQLKDPEQSVLLADQSEEL